MGRQLLRIVVTSPDRRRVLARPNGLAGWILPVVPRDGDDPAWTQAEDEAARRLVAADLSPVRRLDERTWELEPLGRVPAVGNTWIVPEEASRLGADADAVRRWVDAEATPAAAAHLRPGWRASVQDWLDERFGAHDRVVVVRHWELAAVLAVSAGGRDLVVKEPAPGFDREAAVLAALDGLPGAPTLVEVDGARFATEWSGPMATVPPAQVAESLGRLHRGAIDRLDQLRAAGCPAVDDVVSGMHPAVDDALATLAALDLPVSVVHGDAHGANVVGSDDLTIVDWTDATIGCPAVDLDLIVGHDGAPPDDAEQVTDAWCRGFGCDPGPLRAAMPAARIVAAALSLALYRQHGSELPPTILPQWDRWTQAWETRLDRLVG